MYIRAEFAKGSGLGTRLFPWARATIYADKNNAPMIAPHWVRFRIGPLVRGGLDLGAYHRQILMLGLFKNKFNYIGGIRRFVLENIARKVSEPKIFDMKDEVLSNKKNYIVNFKGDCGRFESLFGWDSYLLNELRKITNEKWLNFVDDIKEVPIGINVRLGNDFIDPSMIDRAENKEAVKTPVDWFVDVLNCIRTEMGYKVSAYVISDGDSKALKKLLELENVIFVRPGCAISDLLILSKSKVLIRSGGSSFSAWAAFLGQMPSLSPPSAGLEKFNLKNRYGYFVGDFDPLNPDKNCMADIKKSLSL